MRHRGLFNAQGKRGGEAREGECSFPLCSPCSLWSIPALSATLRRSRGLIIQFAEDADWGTGEYLTQRA